MKWESDVEQAQREALRFKDFVEKNHCNIRTLPSSYQNLIIRAECNMSKTELEELDPIERYKALTFATITYKGKLMTGKKGKGKNQGSDFVSFDQKEDFDEDPNFFSKV